MAKRFEGQVIWVTGASSGIGESLALLLSQEGAKLILSARRRELLEAVKSKCARPSDVCVLPVDVAETDKAEAHVADALKAFGRVDVMVHNAGIGQRSLAAETPLSDDRRIMEVNYFGVLALTKALLPAMQKQQRGHFVVVSSVAGYVGTPQRSTYAASKHALHGFFESLRGETHKDNIAITMICPGFIDTEISVKAVKRAGGDESKVVQARSKMKAHGLPPEAAAKAMARGIAKRSREVHVGGKELAGIYMRRFAPGVLSELLKRVETT